MPALPAWPSGSCAPGLRFAFAGVAEPDAAPAAAWLAMPLGGHAGFAGVAVWFVRAEATLSFRGCGGTGRRAGCGVACDAAWRPCRLCRRGRLVRARRGYALPSRVWRSRTPRRLRRGLRCRLEAMPALPAWPSGSCAPRLRFAFAGVAEPVDAPAAASLAMPLGGHAGFAGVAVWFVRAEATLCLRGCGGAGRRAGCGVACDAAWRPCRLCRRGRLVRARRGYALPSRVWRNR